MNLLRNACEAMVETEVPERVIRIGVRLTNILVEVSIQDHGHGLPVEGYERLLRPFVSTKSNGMGMGLAVSSRIIESNGGKLWATANEESGTTFYFTVPRVGPGETQS